jgi:hypothetical protein
VSTVGVPRRAAIRVQRSHVGTVALAASTSGSDHARKIHRQAVASTGYRPRYKRAQLATRYPCTRGLSGGFDLIEAEDVREVTKFACMRSDQMKLDVTPVVDDDDLNAVFRTVAG